MNPITEQVVERQLNALGSDRYVIAVWDRAKQSMIEERASAETILRTGSHLEQLNRRGRDIYIRPDDPLRFTFIDDLKRESIGQMKRDGFQPAVIVETSPGNFQAWLKHPQPLPEKRLGTMAAQYVAKRYGADLSGAAYQHNGRLAGFQNLKEKHYNAETKRHPYIKLVEAVGRVYPAAHGFIEHLARELAAMKQAEFRRSVMPIQPSERELRSIEQFRTFPRFGGDLGRADLAWSVYAGKNGLSADQIAQAIRTRDLSHKGDAQRQREYIERTLRKADRTLGRGR